MKLHRRRDIQLRGRIMNLKK